MYKIINRVTGEVKSFTSFENMSKWWTTLSILQSLEWGGWIYVQSDSRTER